MTLPEMTGSYVRRWLLALVGCLPVCQSNITVQKQTALQLWDAHSMSISRYSLLP